MSMVVSVSKNVSKSHKQRICFKANFVDNSISASVISLQLIVLVFNRHMVNQAAPFQFIIK